MKHCIKLCTKIQIYYSYCIPFSTDFLHLFFQFSQQQHSQAGKTWVLPGTGGSCWPCSRDVALPEEGRGCHRACGWQRLLAEGAPAPTPSRVTLAPSRCFGTAPSLTTAPRGLRARLTGSRQPQAPQLAGLGDGSCRALHCRLPAASTRHGPASLAAAPLPGSAHPRAAALLHSLCPAQPHSQALPSAWVQPCQGPRQPLACRSPGSWGPCKQPPATRTETRPVLRTLLHCKGCSDPSPPRPGPGEPTSAGLASRAAAGPRLPVPRRVLGVSVPAPGCCVCD